MLVKKNLLKCLTVISCCGSVISILIGCITNISPITGIFFPLYILILFLVSVTFSFKFLQWLLHLNKPINYDLEDLVKNYPYLSFLTKYLLKVNKGRKSKRTRGCKEYDTNELSVISTVLERKLVSSWYVTYISQEIGFPFACKQLLDQMIGRSFQICSKIDSKEVCVDVCTIAISHLKEYKKALKRHEKNLSSGVDSHYKKTHTVSNNPKKGYSAEHCTNILRIVLKELVPWELWDTPHLELLVRILSKKLDNFIDVTLADPVWLNDKLLELLKYPDEKATESESTEEVVEENVDFSIDHDTVPDVGKQEISLESALSTVITTTAPILHGVLNDADIDFQMFKDKGEDTGNVAPLNGSEPQYISKSPILRQRRGRQGRNEVKIYDRVIEGSVKTWESDMDLQCISLGQDLLASLDGEITLSRLWGQDADADGSPNNPARAKSPQPLWFGEEDTIDSESTESNIQKDSSPVMKEHSPKPTDALLKDLQSTVHQAKSKIGDLQVLTLTDVSCKPADEAAGMMEGLLDFGIAGLKKGLRFTGFSDDSQEKSPQHHKDKGLEKNSSPEMQRMRPMTSEPKEIILSTVIEREDNGNTVPHLIKQQRVTSQDSVLLQGKVPKTETPPVPIPIPLSDSPELQYEEAADLSTSIAKLRSLLQQRADASPIRGEDVWWESAEETRGRTQHHHSSKPVDTATLADEYDMNADRNSSPGQMSNNMQRLDKLFQRTVTGVFNSIKTAVGAEGDEVTPHPLHEWTYVCTSVELSVGGAVARLVGSRRAFTHVDAALDTLDQLVTPPVKKDIVPEDFEEWCSVYGAGWCAITELATAVGIIDSHVTYRIFTLLFADLAESLINVWLEEVTSWMKQQVFVLFEQMSNQTDVHTYNVDKKELRKYDLEKTCDAVMGKLPGLFVFGEDTVRDAVKLSLSSFSHKEVNRDVIFRVLDIFALHFKEAARLRSLSFDVN